MALLPHEILTMIFNYVPATDLRTLHAIMLTSRQSKSSIEERYRAAQELRVSRPVQASSMPAWAIAARLPILLNAVTIMCRHVDIEQLPSNHDLSSTHYATHELMVLCGIVDEISISDDGKCCTTIHIGSDIRLDVIIGVGIYALLNDGERDVYFHSAYCNYTNARDLAKELCFILDVDDNLLVGVHIVDLIRKKADESGDVRFRQIFG